MHRKAIGFQLVAARRRAGLTQAEVAERMGTTQSAISRVESGATLPGLAFIERYANAIGSPIGLTFGASVQPSPRERRRRVRRALGDYVFDPWERDPAPAEQRSLVADGLTRERFSKRKTSAR